MTIHQHNIAPDVLEEPSPSLSAREIGGRILGAANLAETKPDDQDQIRLDEIENDPLLDLIPSQDRAEVIAQTYELYRTAKENVAPVIAGFADNLLREAEGRKVVFAARDGLAPHIAASILKKKFEHEYASEDPEQLVYAYLTRAVVRDTPNEVLKEYLQQLGVSNPEASVILADIGMFGSMLGRLRKVLPNLDPRYLISKNSRVPGYTNDRHGTMSSVFEIQGNPAIHFLEDTFSGLIPTPTSIIRSDGKLVPSTINESHSPEETLKRTYALRAVEDFAEGLAAPPDQPATAAIAKLNTFLGDPSSYRHLMVPHK